MASETYDFLDDVQEREWLIGLEPQAVLDNAHRMYDFMAEQGVDQDSFLRELAFTKAAEALGLDYDVLYNAWLDQVPAGESVSPGEDAMTLTDRQWAQEVDENLAALWDVESSLVLPLTWAADAVFRAVGMSRPESTRSRFERSPHRPGTLAQALQACAAIADQPLPERSWEARPAKEALAKFEAARAARQQVKAAQEPFNEEYRLARWNRAYLVLNTNGHVHSSRACDTCFPTTAFGWLPQLSGAGEAEIVEQAGESACTRCYASAPVASLSQPRRVFHQSEVEAQAAREAREVAKAERAAKKAEKALEIDLRPFGLTGYDARIETLAAAKSWLTNSIVWGAFSQRHGQNEHPSYPAAAAQAVAEAIATKVGTSPEDEIAAAAKRAAKRK